MTTRRLASVLLAAVASCGAGGRQRNALEALHSGYQPFPEEVDVACRLAASRCTRCHSIDRVVLTRVENREHWIRYVERMRRQPGSGISMDDAGIITRCLVFRSFEAEVLR